MNLLGYSTFMCKREMVTFRFSIGSRSKSIVRLEASQNSSAKRIPLWANEISPGRIVSVLPPPRMAALVEV